MSKLKTVKSVAKRFKVTKSGKIKRAKAYQGHIKTKKTAKRKRNLRKSALVSRSDKKSIRKALPYR